MSIIQKWKNHQHMTKMNNNILLNPSSFEDLAVELKNKKNIQIFKCREVLVLFMIKHFPEVVLGNGVFDYYLQHKANKIFSSYKLMCNSESSTIRRMYYHHFWSLTDSFNEYFQKWKSQDIYRITLPLLQEYHALKDLITSERVDPESIPELTELLLRTESKIKQVYHRHGDTEKLINEFVPVSLQETVILDFHNKFWRDFYTAISKKDYSQVPILLADILNLIKKIIPTRIDIHAEYTQTIDIVYITQLIESGILTGTDIHEYLKYIFGLIKTLESASEDTDTQMTESLITDMFAKKFNIEQILTFSFSKIMTKLETIITQLAAIS